MTRHTLSEYQTALQQETGLLLDILVYENMSPEKLGLWMQGVEVAQVPDVSDLSLLTQHLPSPLVNTREDFQERLRVVAALQQPHIFEKALIELPAFASLIASEAAALDHQIPPLTIIRNLRDRIARLIWDANPLLLRQLQRMT
ncbi:hypothetical protein EXS70_04260 [Candidatus Peribacteria bacterium]|nr:hypothetical protein [Candidatus Peribacteria bacterium]